MKHERSDLSDLSAPVLVTSDWLPQTGPERGDAAAGKMQSARHSLVRAPRVVQDVLVDERRTRLGSGRVYHDGCRSRDPTPAAMSRPNCPCTDSGCNATVRFDPPTRMLAPRPAAIDISADAPV